MSGTDVGPMSRKDYMGACDQATTEEILDYFYEQVGSIGSHRCLQLLT